MDRDCGELQSRDEQVAPVQELQPDLSGKSYVELKQHCEFGNSTIRSPRRISGRRTAEYCLRAGWQRGADWGQKPRSTQKLQLPDHEQPRSRPTGSLGRWPLIYPPVGVLHGRAENRDPRVALAYPSGHLLGKTETVARCVCANSGPASQSWLCAV